MQATKPNRLSKYAGYWTVCLSCCDWSEDAVGDCWNPAPCVGWHCPKCAAGRPIHEQFPLVEKPKPTSVEPKPLSWLGWLLLLITCGGE